MVYYDHGLVGATLAVAVGAQRRCGWPAVFLAALAAMFPDWDAASKRFSPEAYAMGHRVWGHNLFAVTLAGAALGGLGYWIYRSRSHRFPQGSPTDPGGAGPWIALGIAVLWTHPLLDLLYCGWERDAAWPVRLFWPVVPAGFARPWMPWQDWGATVLLMTGLLGCALARRHRQLWRGCAGGCGDLCRHPGDLGTNWVTTLLRCTGGHILRRRRCAPQPGRGSALREAGSPPTPYPERRCTRRAPFVVQPLRGRGSGMALSPRVRIRDPGLRPTTTWA